LSTTGAADKVPVDRLRRTIRFADPAHDLGVDLLPFRGPLVAFVPVPERRAGDAVFLGGDLHAVHPDTRGPGARSGRDESLDLATVTLCDGEGRQLDIRATEGVWCTRLEGAALECAPYFRITDALGRLRCWLILPPARMMIGIAQLWLPRVPKPPGRPVA
jgi:hypothetical protein